MKATIERATLLKSLSHVQSVVERRNTIPILSNVLLDAREDGSIRLMATDLDLQVDESVPGHHDTLSGEAPRDPEADAAADHRPGTDVPPGTERPPSAGPPS